MFQRIGRFRSICFVLLATESIDKSEAVKAGLLLHSVGDAARRMYNTLVFDAEADKLNYTKIIGKFEDYITKKKYV